ncbi:polysaccharide pyruvyl transferase family protein [Dendronalium sp. ChiSLP03b]|uniref:polysaccharide pyruvyl transferase family protein n=1 Tax=Dendronalium sp. ChiSLP03b TaxID=3075381 RepID=UPI002AD2FDDE|nr:polysaccharide pyruvyl transferase family protein [Dendronalium sp. ChiSLP03b]MDZ8206521.1 polysaccharide pyruvyl transferase family protein [Dendronalium sp. ChiSLP03b]
MKSQKIVICGEVFSNNIGDAIIAETFSYLIKTSMPSIKVDFLDLSLREELDKYILLEEEMPSIDASKTSLKLFMWKLIIKVFSHRGATTLWWFFKWRPQRYRLYKHKLKGASMLIIGGGQLLADNNFDFPLKIYGVSQCAKKLGLPFYFYGCGVSYHWSRLATFLFSQALNHATSITVRDIESLNRLSKRIPGILTKLNASHDIATCCAEAYGIHRKENSQYIGLGVAEPDVLKRHSKEVVKDFFSENKLLTFWSGIVHELITRKLQFKFFTNGSATDQLFAEAIVNSLVESRDRSDVLLPRPTSGKALVETISDFRGIVAFRLHACIVAYSLGIPVIGIKWDDKLESFFKESKQENYCFEASSITSAKLVDSLVSTISQGVDTNTLNSMKMKTIQEVEKQLLVATQSS